MSAIIKYDNLASLSNVRPLLSTSPVTAIPANRADEERERLRKRIEVLEAEVRQREVAISGLKADVEQAFKDGEDRGLTVGRQAVEDWQADRLALLKEGLARANADLRAQLESLDRLAPLLARDCLDIIFGQSDERSEQLRAIIKNQLGMIEKSALVTIEIAREDFPDDACLVVLAEELALPIDVIRINTQMSSGECAMRLKLGDLEIGVKQQWGVLRDLLAQMALCEDESDT